MMEIALRYGLNPHQGQARLTFAGEGAPLRVLNGAPGYINVLDALGSWQLVHEAHEATGVPAAACFKHCSPAGAAIARPLSEEFICSQFLAETDLSPVATAYVRARGGDRMCAFGDFAAVSDVVDASLARVLRREVSDGIIAPGYEPEALAILKEKRQGKYLVMQIDPTYTPAPVESRQVFGFELRQERNAARVDPTALGKAVSRKTDVPADVAQTLALATIALKYTQSNSICIAYDGQVIGMGAGQQSRVHCTRLACGKADKWFCQMHPRVLELPFAPDLPKVDRANIVDQFLLWDELSPAECQEMRAHLTADPRPLTEAEKRDWIARFQGVAMSSDAFIPFRDNIDRAQRSGVRYVLEAGGSLRDDEVIKAADEYGMVLLFSGMRWFLH